MERILLGNSLTTWLVALGTVVAVLMLVALVKWFILHRLSVLTRRTETVFDDSLIEMVRRTRLALLLFPALYLGSQSLTLPEKATDILEGVAALALLIQVGFWGVALLEFWIGHYKRRTLETDAASATTLGAMSFVGKLVLWSVVLLMALDNLGIEVTALVAGLGVGGIAVALAVQSILGDLFASLSIVIDKPFVLGDFIVVDQYVGTVEHIGLKTTRIRSLGGEQIVFANSDLLGTRVRNYKRMRERRIVFTFGVVYQTPAEKLERIPGMVREIVEQREHARFDRAHFIEFGDSAYTYEVVYWMLNPDFALYRDTQQEINLELVRAFAREGIEFAYPTRTVFVEMATAPAAAGALAAVV